MTLETLPSAEKDLFKIVTRIKQVIEQSNSSIYLTDGDKGDITVSSTGATWAIDANAVTTAKIADSNVTTAKIADDNVTNTKLANMDQSTIKGRAAGAGTGDPTDLTATQATAILNAFTDALKGLVPASGGGTANFLRADGTFAAPPAGAVLQVLQNTYATNTSLSTTIPLDDTIPTNTEGTEVLSQAITPADNTNKVLVQVCVWGAVGTINTAMIVALFRDTTCINVASHTYETANFPACVVFSFLDSPASASAQTYSVRVGASSGNCRLNGSNAARQYGGAASSTLTVSEIAA